MFKLAALTLVAGLGLAAAGDGLFGLNIFGDDNPGQPTTPPPTLPNIIDLDALNPLSSPSENSENGGLVNAIAKEIQAIKQPIAETLSKVVFGACKSVKKLLGVSYNQLENEDDIPDLNKLTLRWTDGVHSVVFNISTAAEEILNTPEFNQKKPLVIFCHGYTENATTHSAIIDSFHERGQNNVLALDSSSLIKWLYLRSSSHVRFIGQKLGQVLARMVESGLDSSKVHVIGHSLGGHIAGFTGKMFTNLTGLKVGRVTGLDPAGPCFSDVNPLLRLGPNDGVFVDVIHTDIDSYGLHANLGTVDFYVNSGKEQPGCFWQTCSHARSVDYFAESVVRPKAFPAVRCKDWEAFKTHTCEKGGETYMGFGCPRTAHGVYFLQTNSEVPYGRGPRGMLYENNQALVKTIIGD